MTSSAQPLTGRCILIAEDEYLIARDLGRMLTNAGCAEVCMAPSMAESERILAEKRLDAALLDLQLQDGEAGTLVQRLRAQHVAVVFITGYSENAVPAGYGDVPVLPKPVPRQRLLSALTQLLPPRT
jgi:DNA-binding NtrC family response regulator